MGSRHTVNAELAPGALIKFSKARGGAYSKGGTYLKEGCLFCLSIFGLKMTLVLFFVNLNCNIKIEKMSWKVTFCEA